MALPDAPQAVLAGLGETNAETPPATVPDRTMADLADELSVRRSAAHFGHDPEADAHHLAQGKLLARQRIDKLLDQGTFTELGTFAEHPAAGLGPADPRPEGDGVITGWGEIDGRKVFVFAHDARVRGGALGATFAAKIHQLLDFADSVGTPVIGLNDGGGARIQEGLDALAGFGKLFARNVRASGVVPQISVVLGSCAGGAVYSPALTDFTFMVEGMATMFITGPDVVHAVTGEKVTPEELGGAYTHGTRTGVASFVTPDEESCFSGVRELLSYLPSNNAEPPPHRRPLDAPDRRCEELLRLVPVDDRTPYDIRTVIDHVVDDGDYLEVQENWATNIVCVLARLDGHPVGVVGNQPAAMAGVLDIDSAEKAARFVRTCDAFNIPLVTLVDVPGFMPGTDQEHNAIIRRGAKLLYAYCEATVPRVQVVLRKAFGAAYIVMDSKSIGADLSFAWPSNRMAVTAEQVTNPFAAARHGHVDDVIDPADTRRTLIKSLDMLRTKRVREPLRKHGNEPL
nr:acyl-CoA carboxylase subunit beta [Actinoplanes lichenicola]